MSQPLNTSQNVGLKKDSFDTDFSFGESVSRYRESDFPLAVVGHVQLPACDLTHAAVQYHVVHRQGVLSHPPEDKHGLVPVAVVLQGQLALQGWGMESRW